MDNLLRQGFRLNEWQVLPLEGQLVGPAGVVHLEPKVMAVLVLLARTPGQLVEREVLIREVWGERTVSDEPLTRCIAVLRRALGDSPKNPKCIQTLPKRGYRLVAEVIAESDAQSVFDPAAGRASAADAKPPQDVSEQRSRQPAARIVLFAALGVSLAALVFVVGREYLSNSSPAPDGSIAVLPFENLSPDPENAFFADGIHDDLLSRLAKIDALTVISRTSVLEYRDSPKNLRQIGQELGVTAILEGGVRRAGNTIRINVDLIDAQTDKHLWVETYDRQLTAQNLFSIQSEMATSIAHALRAELLPAEVASLDEKPTQNTRAYDFYLNANDYFRRREEAAPLSLALELYQRAVDEDPQFALAWAALSRAHSHTYWTGADRTESRLRLAYDAVQRAFEIAPGLPEGRLALGQYWYRGFRDYERALEETEIAATGMPGNVEIAVARAEIHRRLGDWNNALAYYERAMTLDPRNPFPLWQRGLTFLAFRDYDAADQALARALELAPDDNRSNQFWVLVPFLRNGDVSRAQAVLDGPRPNWFDATYPLWWTAAVYQRDYEAALGQLNGWSRDASNLGIRFTPKASLYGVTYQLAGQPELAQPYFETARAQVARALEANPEDERLRIALGEALAGLGDRQGAEREAREAMRLMPTSEDAMRGPTTRRESALRVLLPAGAYDSVIAELDTYLAGPGQWSIEGLLPDPRLDPIRDDPRFQALVEKYRRR